MPAIVGQVTNVEQHPESENLDVVTINGKINVANRPEPNQPRYKVGDYAVVLEDGLILPEWLLKELDMWDHAKNKGGLAGNKGNRTKGRKIAGVFSEVALYAAENNNMFKSENDTFVATVNHDVRYLLGIVDYVPA